MLKLILMLIKVSDLERSKLADNNRFIGKHSLRHRTKLKIHDSFLKPALRGSISPARRGESSFSGFCFV
jgi:hypothetical protein